MFSNTQFAVGAVAVALLAPSIQAVPTPSQNKAPTKVNLERRGPIASVCTQNDIMPASDFTLYNNLWGEGYATSGSQCTYLDYSNANSISWQTAWSWEDASDVKSYANAVLNIPATQLSTITSLASTWNWTYTGESLLADVSYDAFLSSEASTTGEHDYEIMIWLSALGGAEPIGYGTPVASVPIGDYTWDLYQGTNTVDDDTWTVFSFVAQSEITYFTGDINDFFTYLIDNNGVPSSYYLQTIGAGTEAFTGADAWFTVSPYTISLN